MYFSLDSKPADHKDLGKHAQAENFQKNARKVVDYICGYTKNIGESRTFPDIEAGYLVDVFPDMPPQEPEDFDTIMKDFTDKIMTGTVHWRHHHSLAYFNCGNALANVLGDMLSTACGGVGFSWTAQPAITEVENLMMDWMGRAMNLPSKFLFSGSNGKGGGSTQNSASDSIFNVTVAARYTKLKQLGCYSLSNSTTMEDPIHPSKYLDKLICYTSTESHSSVEKAANIAMVQIRLLKSDQNRQITGDILEDAIIEDKKNGRIPFLFHAVMGSTGRCGFDDLESTGLVCKKHGLWFHVDAAYAGNALMLPEMAHLGKGLGHADSIDVSPYKLSLAAIDSGCLWVSDVEKYKEVWLIDASYLMNKYEYDNDLDLKTKSIDYRHYGVPLSKRMRALKFYFLLRMYGVRGIREYQRRVIGMAKLFEQLVRADDRFRVTCPATLGVVCFKQKSPIEEMVNFNYVVSDCQMSYGNRINMNLVYRCNSSRQLHMLPAFTEGSYQLRISVNYEYITEENIREAWEIIKSFYVEELDEIFQVFNKEKTPASEKRMRMMSQMTYVSLTDEPEGMGPRHLRDTFDLIRMHADSVEDTIFHN